MHVTRSEQKAAMCYSDRPGNDGVVIKLKVALGTYAGIYEQGHPLQKTWMEQHGCDSSHQTESPKRPPKKSAQGRLPQSDLPQ